jgi:hypothetical protein
MRKGERARPWMVHESMELRNRKLLDWAYKDGEPTKEFKKWFGRSVLKDKTGKPLVFYHGTSADFTHFDESKMQEMGFHFGSAPAAGEKSYHDNGRIYPVVIAMRNPLRLTDVGGGFSLMRVWSQVDARLSYQLCKRSDTECQRRIGIEVYQQRTEEQMRAYLVSKGFDGIIYGNKYEDAVGNYDSVIVFDMKQVRSAIDGSFLTESN